MNKRGRIRLKRTCFYCEHKIEPDFKNYKILRKFVTERGKILPRRITSTCGKHQRRVAMAVKRARHMALLPFVAENISR
jgi:small subunit ribosomal protein S18